MDVPYTFDTPRKGLSCSIEYFVFFCIVVFVCARYMNSFKYRHVHLGSCMGARSFCVVGEGLHGHLRHWENEVRRRSANEIRPAMPVSHHGAPDRKDRKAGGDPSSPG